ncbi:hypothetical protein AGMMS49992_04010 [Clostridia bacterium]|nr:hypothetical protein AGMMS49992_04010 [Clostridia bacterium]
MFKKLLAFALCALMLAGLMPASYALAYVDTAVVSNTNTADRLNLRTQPKTTAPYLCRYYNGTEVKVISYGPAGWAYVSIDNIQGYMSTDYLATGPFIANVRSAKSTMYVVAANEKLRYRPNSTSGTSGSAIKKGTKVEVKGVAGDWSHIGLLDGSGRGGFVKSSILSTSASGTGSSGSGGSSSSNNGTIAIGGTAVVNNPVQSDRLNLRSTPSSSGTILARYYNGVQVRVLGIANGEWVKVRVGLSGSGVAEGYMMSKYLAFGSAGGKVTSRVPTKRNRSASWTLNMQPTANAEKVKGARGAALTFGTSVTIQVLGERADGWWHVRVSGSTTVTGYINSKTSSFQ